MLFNSTKEFFCVTPYKSVIKSRNVLNSINEIISNVHLQFATHADIIEF